MTAKPLDIAQFDGHTPGPWTIVQDGNPRQNPYWYAAELHAGPLLVGRIECTNAQREKGEHTARLIAAAPALLTQCRRQREQIQALRQAMDEISAYAGLMVPSRGSNNAAKRDRIIALARAALEASAALAKVAP